MKNYIGAKIIKAKLTTLDQFKIKKYGKEAVIREGDDKIECYLVVYAPIGKDDTNCYISMSPKNVFEKCYREIEDKEIELINRVDSFLNENKV